MSVAVVVPSDGVALETCQVGSTFERVPIGWRVKWVDGGTAINVEGATITEALGSHGLQIVHPSIAKENAEIAAKAAAEKRSPDQDTAIEQAFVAGTLPEEDRRTA